MSSQNGNSNIAMAQQSPNNNSANADVEKQSLLSSPNENGTPAVAKASGGGSGSGIVNMFGGKVIFACFLYSFCSVAMVLTNKSLASSYNHLLEGDLNVMLVVFQAVVAVICVEFCKRLNIIESYAYDMSIAKMWAPVNLFFCGMLFTGMTALQHNTVPMVTVFKNVANIITTFGDWYFFGTVPEVLVLVAFAVMLGGACLAAINDVEITAMGIFWMVANCFCTAGYVLYMKFATKNVKMSKFGMVFYNNVLCTIFLFPVAFMWGEVKILVESKAIHTADYFGKNVFAGFVGFFLNFASLNCVSHTGPTTYAVIGSLNKIPTTILGYFMFKTVITPETWFFICVSMLGGFLYSYAKIRAGMRKNAGGGDKAQQAVSSVPDAIRAICSGDRHGRKVGLLCLFVVICGAFAIITNRRLTAR